MLYLLVRNFGIPHELEHVFARPRRWRFDIAFPEHKVAIEYEGVMGYKSRHTTISGYTGDCEKYNTATILGWRVLRYTAKNVGNVLSDLPKLITI